MFKVPKVMDLKAQSSTEIILLFDSGIIKVIDIRSFKDNKDDDAFPEVSLIAEGILFNNHIIKNCDLWSMGKFLSWDKDTKRAS